MDTELTPPKKETPAEGGGPVVKPSGGMVGYGGLTKQQQEQEVATGEKVQQAATWNKRAAGFAAIAALAQAISLVVGLVSKVQ